MCIPVLSVVVITDSVSSVAVCFSVLFPVLVPVVSDVAVTAGFSVLNNEGMAVDVLPAALVVKSGV